MLTPSDLPETAESLLERAAQLPHAICRDYVFDSNGKLERIGELHYLTCVRCELERRAKGLSTKPYSVSSLIGGCSAA